MMSRVFGRGKPRLCLILSRWQSQLLSLCAEKGPWPECTSGHSCSDHDLYRVRSKHSYGYISSVWARVPRTCWILSRGSLSCSAGVLEKGNGLSVPWYNSCSDHDWYRVRRKGHGCPELCGSHIVGRLRRGFR